ncbi:MAG: metallophosphoesterase [Anaerolineae bacterium]|nr:metallophosphoesterase [Anaerolineae bacterium]
MMTPLHFAQISDIHISSLGDYEEILSGRAAGFLEIVLTDLNQQPDLDFVLFTGDLFNTPEPSNVALFQQVIQMLQKPYYIIPGNHDRRNANQSEGLTRHDFARLFNLQVEARPTHTEAQNGYWSITVKPKVQLIGLDSNRDADWGGIIDAAQVEWLEQELLAHADKLIVLAVHHPFHPLAPVDFEPGWSNFVCDNGPDMLALLDRHPQVKLVLTGHHHQTKADVLGRRLHLACPALAVYPCAYRTLRLTQPAEGRWQIEWQTHPATDNAILAEARQMMLAAWQKAGFTADFVEQHAELAYGNDWDRQGRLEDWKTGRA